jgi:hypothetical protein
VQKTRKPSAFGSRKIKNRPRARKSERSIFPGSPPDGPVSDAVFPTDLMLRPPTGSVITALPIAVVRDPQSERLLMRKSEPSPAPAGALSATPLKKPRVAKKTTTVKAKTAKTLKPKAIKPKAAPRKTPSPRKAKVQKIAANDTGVAPTIAAAMPVPVKDVAPAVPPTLAANAPLPRAAAVTPWRKNGPIDVLAYWVRSTARSLLARFNTKKSAKANVRRPAPPQAAPALSELEQLRAENAALKERVELLLDSRMERMKDA